MYDKGKPGSVVETETVIAEKGGAIYTRALGSAFFVGQGNWGGPKGVNPKQWMVTICNVEKMQVQAVLIILHLRKRSLMPYIR